MINTLNESSLHKTLKLLYSSDDGDRTEVEQDGHIYDIVKKDGTIIEIQTQNLGKLRAKMQDILQSGKTCVIVHPVVLQKTIEIYDKNGILVSRRKSPKKGSIYSMFRELTGLCSVLLTQNFTLEILLTNITEQRIRTDEPVQSANRQRRIKKDWLKTDKKLEEIIEKRSFKNAKDYLALLPEGLGGVFCVKDIEKSLKKNKTLPASAAGNAALMLWVLRKTGLVEQSGTKSRARTYRINPQYSARADSHATEKARSEEPGEYGSFSKIR